MGNNTSEYTIQIKTDNLTNNKIFDIKDYDNGKKNIYVHKHKEIIYSCPLRTEYDSHRYNFQWYKADSTLKYFKKLNNDKDYINTHMKSLRIKKVDNKHDGLYYLGIFDRHSPQPDIPINFYKLHVNVVNENSKIDIDKNLYQSINKNL